MRSTPLQKFTRSLLVLGILSLVGCDKNQFATIDSTNTPPTLGNATINPDSVNIDSLIPNNDIFTVSTTVRARVVDPDGQATLNTVSIDVINPYTGRIVARANLHDEGTAPDNAPHDSIFSGVAQFSLTRSGTGPYRIRIIASDVEGLESEAIERTLFLTRNNSVPELSLASAPDTLIRPSSGFALILFAVVASDSDGYEDIADVFFKQISPTPSSIISMFDDGDIIGHGDYFPGDGVFSRIVQIDSSNTLGDKVFLFQARDRFGTLSDSLVHTVTVIHD